MWPVLDLIMIWSCGSWDMRADKQPNKQTNKTDRPTDQQTGIQTRWSQYFETITFRFSESQCSSYGFIRLQVQHVVKSYRSAGAQVKASALYLAARVWSVYITHLSPACSHAPVVARNNDIHDNLFPKDSMLTHFASCDQAVCASH